MNKLYNMKQLKIVTIIYIVFLYGITSYAQITLSETFNPSLQESDGWIEITAIPDVDNDALPDDSHVLFEKIRENILSLASGTKNDFESNCIFGLTPDIWWNFEDYPGFVSPRSSERWLSDDPISTIFLIDA
jgi:hypothetical protein